MCRRPNLLPCELAHRAHTSSAPDRPPYTSTPHTTSRSSEAGAERQWAATPTSSIDCVIAKALRGLMLMRPAGCTQQETSLIAPAPVSSNFAEPKQGSSSSSTTSSSKEYSFQNASSVPEEDKEASEYCSSEELSLLSTMPAAEGEEEAGAEVEVETSEDSNLAATDEEKKEDAQSENTEVLRHCQVLTQVPPKVMPIIKYSMSELLALKGLPTTPEIEEAIVEAAGTVSLKPRARKSRGPRKSKKAAQAAAAAAAAAAEAAAVNGEEEGASGGQPADTVEGEGCEAPADGQLPASVAASASGEEAEAQPAVVPQLAPAAGEDQPQPEACPVVTPWRGGQRMLANRLKQEAKVPGAKEGRRGRSRRASVPSVPAAHAVTTAPAPAAAANPPSQSAAESAVAAVPAVGSPASPPRTSHHEEHHQHHQHPHHSHSGGEHGVWGGHMEGGVYMARAPLGDMAGTRGFFEASKMTRGGGSLRGRIPAPPLADSEELRQSPFASFSRSPRGGQAAGPSSGRAPRVAGASSSSSRRNRTGQRLTRQDSDGGRWGHRLPCH